MARRLPVRAGCACATLAVLLAGCTTAATSGTSVSGSTLSVYLSAPPGTPSPEAQDVVSAEKLALSQAGGQVGKFTIKAMPYTGRKLSDTARQAIGDSTTIAYLGEVAPGDSADTLGITNAEDVLQVSPTDTALELTQTSPAIRNSPDRYYEALGTNGRTFARVVPTTALEARAVITEMKALAITSVYVARDGSEYGRALAYALSQDARSASMKVTSGAPDARSFLASGSDAIFLAASAAYTTPAASLLGTIGNTSKAKMFAPSALASNSFAASFSPATAKNLYVSSPGFLPAGTPSPDFISAFRRAYGHDPAPQAVFGFAAMQALLHVLQQAGSSASNRKTVVQDFFALRNFATAAGTISINKNGDVSFGGGAPFIFSRVKAGRLVPEKAVTEQG